MFKQVVEKKYPFRQARAATLAHHEAFVSQTIGPEEYVERLNQLLKRATLYAQKDSRAASLSGQKWLDYLDDLSQSTGFSLGQGKALGEMRYHKNTHFELSDLHTRVLQVIRVLEKNT